MSSFDDEFGLFSETVVDEPEPLDSARGKPSRETEQRPKEPAARKQQPPAAPSDEGYSVPRRRPSRPPARRQQRPSSSSSDPWAGHRRATELLGFLARKLVQKPEAVTVELFIDETAQAVIELIVDPEDLGKVIGRSGRVAQALRTVVRATAEGRVAVDILDSEEAAQDSEDADAGD
ncbi:MAG TPA: KH domain-containing protein [Candidatus Cybelea sp.]|nr:KH domain-containing protein [Candidatus Cybelea sp.]